jgi:hypothetical protein
MPANDYHFVTNWRVEGTCGEVADILRDALALPRWWPAVYLRVDQLAAGDEAQVGQRVRLLTKGWLPYTLNWEFVVVESQYPNGFTLQASGDLDGRGEWTFVQQGSEVEITYDWRIRADKPILRALSFLLKPLFEANHRWAMAQGETSLALELERRRAASDGARSEVPAPPGPVTYAGIALATGAAAATAGIVYLLSRRSRRRSSQARRRLEQAVATDRSRPSDARHKESRAL